MKLKKSNYLIYKLTSPDGKCYIGKTCNFKKRINKYKNYNCKEQPEIYQALLNYKFENFTVEILAENIDKRKIHALETKLIKLNNTLFPYGYNLKTHKSLSLLTKNKLKLLEKIRDKNGKFRNKICSSALDDCRPEENASERCSIQI